LIFITFHCFHYFSLLFHYFSLLVIPFFITAAAAAAAAAAVAAINPGQKMYTEEKHNLCKASCRPTLAYILVTLLYEYGRGRLGRASGLAARSGIHIGNFIV
jgi:hypothetical protein